MSEAVIVDAVRTPIGRAFKGSLKDFRADELAAVPLKALIERNPGVDFSETDDVMMGAASSFAEQAYNVGRNATLLAGFDHHVPGCTVNRFCASSLQTLRMAFHAVTAGEGNQYVAAGVESVSRTGLGAGMADEFKNDKLDGSESSLFDVYIPMGLTAENVAERCHVTREQQDEWAVTSQNRAVDAVQSGHFDREIVPVTLEDGTQISRDDGPRPGTTMEVRARHERRARQGAWPHAEGADHRLERRRHPPGDHGPRADPRHPGAAQAGRHDDGRHRRRRDQRGVRRADRPL